MWLQMVANAGIMSYGPLLMGMSTRSSPQSLSLTYTHSPHARVGPRDQYQPPRCNALLQVRCEADG